jgi:Na+-transporting NADH:ubiquinone oxidoreductase subunit B
MMRMLRSFLDKQSPLFEPGGKLEKLYPLWEAIDTLLYSPSSVSRGTIHVRDGLDLKRMMGVVVFGLLPIVFMAMYNVGRQAHVAIAAGATPLDGWQTTLFQAMGFDFTNALWPNFVHGAIYFLPIFITCFAVGGLIEVLFSVVRKHEVNEGFFVTGFLLPLTLPPTIPLWQVALGTAFGVFIGKEIFGGTGMNVLNPALVSRAFLFFASRMSTKSMTIIPPISLNLNCLAISTAASIFVERAFCSCEFCLFTLCPLLTSITCMASVCSIIR